LLLRFVTAGTVGQRFFLKTLGKKKKTLKSVKRFLILKLKRRKIHMLLHLWNKQCKQTK